MFLPAGAMQVVSGELSLAGASMEDVFKCDVALADTKNSPGLNFVYVKYFKAGHLPARMASGINDWPRELPSRLIAKPIYRSSLSAAH